MSVAERLASITLTLGVHLGLLFWITATLGQTPPAKVELPSMQGVLVSDAASLAGGAVAQASAAEAQPVLAEPMPAPLPPVPVPPPPEPPKPVPVEPAKPVVEPAPRLEPQTKPKPQPKPKPKPTVQPRPELPPSRTAITEHATDAAAAAEQVAAAPPAPSASPAPGASTSGAAPAAVAPAPSGPSPAAPAVTPPRTDAAHLNNPVPRYPPVSRRLGEEGRVMLDVHIQPDGSVGEIRVRSSSGSKRLDQAALDAVKRWRYVPARRGDVAIAFWYVQPIAFSLHE